MFGERFTLGVRAIIGLLVIVCLPIPFFYAMLFLFNNLFLVVFDALTPETLRGGFYVHPAVVVVAAWVLLAVYSWVAPNTIRGSVGAKLASEDEYPDLHASVRRLSRQVDIDRPAVAVLENEAPNTFALRGPGSAAIVTTTGALELLDDRELDAVLAHELSHLKNRDATVMTLSWFLPALTYLGVGGILYLYRELWGDTAEGRYEAIFERVASLIVFFPLVIASLILLVPLTVFWAVSVLFHRMLSRGREYAADRGAAALTGDPAALASALRKMDEAIPEAPDEDLRELDGGTEALCVAPLESDAFSGPGVASADVFPGTHPPTEERIERLRRMTGELS